MKNAIKVVHTKTQFSSWKAKIVQKIPQHEYEKAYETASNECMYVLFINMQLMISLIT